MTNLKINSTSTPYWCVVVPVEAEDLHIYKTAPALEFEMYGIEYGICLPVGNYSILGCITSSGMDEGVNEIVEEVPFTFWKRFDNPINSIRYPDYTKPHLELFGTAHASALSLLQHNQITITSDQKAVVIKQIT